MKKLFKLSLTSLFYDISQLCEKVNLFDSNKLMINPKIRINTNLEKY